MNKLHSSMMRSRVEQAVRGSFCNPNWVTLILLSSLEKLPGQGTRLPVQPFPSLPGLFPAPCRIHRGLQRISSICSLAVASCRLFPQSAPVSLFRLFVGIKRREGDRRVSSFWERGSCTQLWFFLAPSKQKKKTKKKKRKKRKREIETKLGVLWGRILSFVLSAEAFFLSDRISLCFSFLFFFRYILVQRSRNSCFTFLRGIFSRGCDCFWRVVVLPLFGLRLCSGEKIWQ